MKIPCKFSLGRWRQVALASLAGLLFLVTAGVLRADHDFTYYSDSWAYENISGAWLDTSVPGWQNPPYYPGAITGEGLYIIGGEHWRPHSYEGSDYNYDYVCDLWFHAYSNTPCSNPIPGGYLGDGGGDTHNFLYYSEAWAYDTLTDSWFDETLFSPDYTDGTWEGAGSDPRGPDVILLWGDNFSVTTIGDNEYAHDTVTDLWYIFDTDTGGWDESDDPTANWTYLDIGSSVYVQDSVTSDWFVASGANWDATSDPAANWGYLTINDDSYARDSVTHNWYLADGDNWDSVSDPTANWAYVTINSVEYAGDTVTSDWFTNDGSDNWTTTDNPTANWTYITSGSLAYAHDTITDNWFSGSEGVWISREGDPRPQQGPLYVSYSNYVYDVLVDVWFNNYGTAVEAPEDPGEPTSYNSSWDLFIQSNGTWARDYWDVGQWAQYDYENQTWSLSSHRPTHYLHYSGLWAYDTYCDSWFDETIDWGGGDWGPAGDPNIYNGPVYLLSGDDWEYSTIDDVGYAYDPVMDAWFVDTGVQEEYSQQDIWEATDSPL